MTNEIIEQQRLARQRALVAMRLLSPRERRLIHVLSDVSKMSAVESCEELTTRFNGNLNAYRVAVIEREIEKAKLPKGAWPSSLARLDGL